MSENHEKASSSQRGRKFMNVTVYFLDDSSHVFQLQAKNTGQVLFEKVCKFINLLEVDYFGLEFEDERNTKCWLDAIKPLCAQISTSFPTMYFCVKFYMPDPVQLEDEFTRYLFGLQVKKDLANGFLQCNDNTAAVMVSYIVQADFGDFCGEKCSDPSYLSGCKFVPLQDQDLERKIMENHKKIIGQTPAEADLNLLETARRCELYGIKMTAAKDHEGVPLNLAVAHLGVLVFQNYTKINTFSWAKIRKLSFKRKKFLIKLHPEGYGYYKDTVEFFFEGRNECKNFWKKCIENHTFFRCTDAKQGMRQKPKIFSRGSSFRYSGRTQKQVSEFVRENCFKRQPFQRSTSLKTPSSPSRSMGSSVSPQPLLPVASVSCGSMSDVSKEPHQRAPLHSTSEPTTPHAAPPQLPLSGPVTPERGDTDFQSQGEDNVSHDSYHLLEKEMEQQKVTNGDCSLNNATSPYTDMQHNEEPLNNGGYLNDIDLSRRNNKSLHNSTNTTTDAHNEELLTNGGNTPSAGNFKGSLKALEHNNNQLSLESIPSDFTINSVVEERLSTFEVRATIEHVRNDSLSSVDISSEDNSELRNGNSEEVVRDMLNDAQQTFGTSTFYVSSPYAVKLANKKKSLSDKSYCLAKELLMTERTYRKDLEIVDVIFRDEFFKQSDVDSAAAEQMLSAIDPLYELHCSLLRDLEQRLAFWEGRPNRSSASVGIKGIGDILLLHKGMLTMHSTYLSRLPHVLELVYQELSSNPGFSEMYHRFESQKMCYLPLTSFLLRPAFRLLYYKSLLKDLLGVYNSQHVDYENCLCMLNELKTMCEHLESKILPVVNYVKLMELQRSLIGFPDLVNKNREFVREGCLLKFTQNGSHQHMFFLFSDVLLYTVRVHNSQLCFKVQGQLPTSCLGVEEAEPRQGVADCFLITTCSNTPEDKQHLLVAVAAPSPTELSKWKRDLLSTSQKAPLKEVVPLPEDTSNSEEDCIMEDTLSSPASHHINTSIHICWHRNISISCGDLLLSMKHSLSGYLLRKFKNSSGWQKVWVVLANLCLFFYRSYLDESPLASLPLAGYRVVSTCNSDVVHGDCIFKLIFKNHEYFFTVENKHTFERWLDAIGICTLMENEHTRL